MLPKVTAPKLLSVSMWLFWASIKPPFASLAKPVKLSVPVPMLIVELLNEIVFPPIRALTFNTASSPIFIAPFKPEIPLPMFVVEESESVIVPRL